MQRDTLKKYYLIHSWVGVITAILMFVICFSGAVSIFGSPELKLWSNPSLHSEPTVTPQQIDGLLKQQAAQTPDKFKAEVIALLPGASAFGNLWLLFETAHGPDEQMIAFVYDPATLQLKKKLQGSPQEVFAAREANLESFITEFHANLHLDRLGLILTGLLGLTLLASTITGIIIHRKIIKELFVFRPFRSVRLMLTDAHKVLSVWGILFHGMIGFTGAFLGLATIILLPVAAFVSFEGDQEALFETFQPERMPTLSGVPAEMLVSEVLAQSQSLGGTTQSITILGWGDSKARAFSNTSGGDALPSRTHEFTLADAKYVESNTTFGLVGGISGPILDAMFPLHFGSFGGLVVRIVWALLGLSTAMIAVSGMMIWVEKRAYGAEGSLNPEAYLRLNRLSIGACAGMVLATAALFWSQRLAPAHIVTVFFSVWGLSIVFSLSRSNNYQTTRQLIGMSGFVLAAVPLIDALKLDIHLFNSFNSENNRLAMIDLTLFFMGAGMTYLAWLLPSRRKVDSHKTRRQRVDLDEDEKPTLGASALLEE